MTLREKLNRAAKENQTVKAQVDKTILILEEASEHGEMFVQVHFPESIEYDIAASLTACYLDVERIGESEYGGLYEISWDDE